MVYSVANYRPHHLSHFGQICNFRDPNYSLSRFMNFPICRLNEEHFTFLLQYKHSKTLANGKYEELSYPKNPKMCDPILVTHSSIGSATLL